MQNPSDSEATYWSDGGSTSDKTYWSNDEGHANYDDDKLPMPIANYDDAMEELPPPVDNLTETVDCKPIVRRTRQRESLNDRRRRQDLRPIMQSRCCKSDCKSAFRIDEIYEWRQQFSAHSKIDQELHVWRLLECRSSKGCTFFGPPLLPAGIVGIDGVYPQIEMF